MALSQPNHSTGSQAFADLTTIEIEAAIGEGFDSRKTGDITKDMKIAESAKWSVSNEASSFGVSRQDETVALGDAGKYDSVNLSLNKNIVARLPYAEETFRFMSGDAISSDMKKLGTRLSRDFDQAVLGAVVRGALKTGQAAPFSNGINKTMPAADMLNPTKLEKAISEARVLAEMAYVESEEMVIFVRPDLYEVLAQSDMLTSSEFSLGNGDFSSRTIIKAGGMRVIKASPGSFGTAIPNHVLGAGHNVSAAQAKAKIVIATSESVAILASSMAPEMRKIDDEVNHNVILEAQLLLNTAPWNNEKCIIVSEA